MAINKGTLAKEVNGTIEYIYPKTSADIVEYSTGVSAQNKISELSQQTANLNTRVNNMIINAVSGENSPELVDMRQSAFGSKVYDLASEAVKENIRKLAPVKFRMGYLFDEKDSIGAYILNKGAGIEDYKTGIPLNKISGSSLVVKFYNKANNNLLLTKTINITTDYITHTNEIFYEYIVDFTYEEFDKFKNLTVYPIFTYTPGNGDSEITLNCKTIINHIQKDFKPIFDYSGISTT